MCEYIHTYIHTYIHIHVYIIECFSGPGQWHANEACCNAIPDWKCVHAKLEQLCMHTGLSLSLCVWSGLSLSDTSSFRFLLHLPRMLNSLSPVRLNLRPHALADTCVC